MNNRTLKELQEFCDKFEEYEKQIHSGKLNLPPDWFWHGQLVIQLRILHDSLEKDIKKFKQQKTDRAVYNLNDLVERIETADKLIEDYLKPMETKSIPVQYRQHQAEKINEQLAKLDNLIIWLIEEFKTLNKQYKDDPDGSKKKQLIAMGLNIFKKPELTRMLLSDWSIIEEMNVLIKKNNNYMSQPTFYIFTALDSFNDLIFNDITKAEIDEIKRAFNIDSNLTIEKIQRDPNYLTNLKQFQQDVSQKKLELYESQKNILKKTILLLTRIILGGTEGSNMSNEVLGRYIPAIRQIVRNKRDIEIIYNGAVKLFNIDNHAPCRALGSILPNFRDIYYSEEEKFLSVLIKIFNKDGFESYQLDYSLLLFKRLIKNLQDFETIGFELMNIFIEWKETSPIGFHSIATNLIQDNKLFLESKENTLLILKFAAKTNSGSLVFCKILIDKYKPKNHAELSLIVDKLFNFVNREIRNNRIKLKQLESINQISNRIFEYFGDYLLYIMEQSPKDFMKILISIEKLLRINGNISKEILTIVKVARTFRLYVDENKFEEINIQDIENTYLFLTQQLNKKSDLDKFRKNLNKFKDPTHRKSGFDYINNVIKNLTIEYLLNITNIQVKDAFTNYCEIPLPKELEDNDDVVNAFLIAKKCHYGKNSILAKEFIKEICLKNTVPFKKYPEAYPYNQKKNIDFLENIKLKGANMKPWIEGEKKQYKPILTDMIKNTKKIIANHIIEVIEEYKLLGMQVKEDEIFNKFQELANHPNQEVVADIKNHLKEIKSLQGQNIYIHSISKVIIRIETNPLKVLQMGNVVSGSCLASSGSNSWTTITNAVDINKRVLYAENEKGDILGRRLITISSQGNIIQYGVYNNAPQIDLSTMFEQFTLELAKEMNLSVANEGETLTLVGESWYAGTPIDQFSIKLKK